MRKRAPGARVISQSASAGSQFRTACVSSKTLQRLACYSIGVMLALSVRASRVGGVIAGAVLGRIASTPVRRAMTHWRALALARLSYRRLAQRLGRLERLRAPLYDRHAPLKLKFANATHRYSRRDRPVVKRLTLTAQPGELIAIHGPSGSGKSTLARLSAGLVAPSSGRIQLGELDIAKLVRSPWRTGRNLPQDDSLPEGTIHDLISGFGDGQGKRVIEAAKGAGIHDVIMQLPEGYDTLLSPNTRPLAGGELNGLPSHEPSTGVPRSSCSMNQKPISTGERYVSSLQRSTGSRRWAR